MPQYRGLLCCAGLALAATTAWAHGPMGGHGPQRGRGGHGSDHGPEGALVRAADADASGDVSAEELAAFLDALPLAEDGGVDVAALAESLPAPPRGQHVRDGAAARAAELLAERLDTDGDGTTTVDEVAALFAALDVNGDGALTPGDRAGAYTPRPMGGRARRGARFVVTSADADASGDVSADEWQTFLAGLGADEAGVIDVAVVLALLPAPAEGSRLAELTDEERAAKLLRFLDRDGDGVLELDDLGAAFDGLDSDDDGALSAEELAHPRAC